MTRRLRTLAFVATVLYVGIVLPVAFKIRQLLGELPAVHTLDKYSPSLATKLYDVRGELITELFVEKRSVIPLTQIPVDMQRAVLAIEDDNFYNHPGIDLKAIVRATLRNFRSGRVVQGASTITQQTAKNIFLTQEKTVSRKIKELLLTFQMEASLSKDEILQLYLNQIYFGHGAYGIESAAKTFFGKHAQELSLPECALLAGLPRSPGAYSPFNHPDRALTRRRVVLHRMQELGFIGEKEEMQAEAQTQIFSRGLKNATDASYFVENVRLELEPRYGADALYREGFSIYTTMDLRMQRAAEVSAQKYLTAFDEKYADQRLKTLLQDKRITDDFYARWKKWKENPAKTEDEPEEKGEPMNVQGALVAVDPHTGGIRAMVGGRDFQKSQFNRATQAKRQPGSTFKPFVWLTALDNGFTAASVVDDYPVAYTDMEHGATLVASSTDYALLREMVSGYYKPDADPDAPDPIWAPQNWDHKFLGPVTLRKGLALSRNLVSIKLIDKVGPRAVAGVAHRAGIGSKLDPVLSLGLGSSVVTVEEMTSAFSTLANGGVHMAPFFILKVVDRHGRTLEEYSPQGQKAFSPQLAYLTTRMMEAVIQEGTGGYARQLGRPAAGKTGTTQDLRDLWFMGFVPDLSAGVWVGYDDFTPLGKEIFSASVTVPWWTEFMMESVKYLPSRDFAVPPGIVFAKIDSDTGFLALPSCPHVALEAFAQGKIPTEFCNVDHDAEENRGDQDVTE